MSKLLSFDRRDKGLPKWFYFVLGCYGVGAIAVRAYQYGVPGEFWPWLSFFALPFVLLGLANLFEYGAKNALLNLALAVSGWVMETSRRQERTAGDLIARASKRFGGEAA